MCLYCDLWWCFNCCVSHCLCKSSLCNVCENVLHNTSIIPLGCINRSGTVVKTEPWTINSKWGNHRNKTQRFKRSNTWKSTVSSNTVHELDKSFNYIFVSRVLFTIWQRKRNVSENNDSVINLPVSKEVITRKEAQHGLTKMLPQNCINNKAWRLAVMHNPGFLKQSWCRTWTRGNGGEGGGWGGGGVRG